MMNVQNFVIRFPEYVDEITTDCLVIKATRDMHDTSRNLVGYPYKALWDTGATNSMITKRVVDQLGLKPVTFAKVFHAGGESEDPVFIVYFSLPNNIIVGPLQVIEGQLEGVEILIGMDIIGNGDFIITNNDNHTSISYTTPSVMKL